MDQQMKMYWETAREMYPTGLLVSKNTNPLRDYEEDFIEGPILELGCGQSALLIEYSKSGREIFAVDNDAYQLQQLRERIIEYKGNADNVNFLNRTILKDTVPDAIFSVVILSNILHFFSMKDCNGLIEQLIERTTKGSLFYIVVHSDKHPRNFPEDPDNFVYFKHYFKAEDLQILFNPEQFEQLYCADVQRQQGKFDRTITESWLNKVLDRAKIFDEKDRKEEIDDYMEYNRQADLLVIYKKK